MNTCTHCGQPIRAARPKRPTLAVSVHVETMTDAELFAYRKKTAPLEDLRFALRHATLSPELRAGFEALELAQSQMPLPRAEFYRIYCRLQEQWRLDANARERHERLDAGEVLDPNGFWHRLDDPALVVVPAVFEEDEPAADVA